MYFVSLANGNVRLFEYFVRNITPRKRARIVTLSEHAYMAMRSITDTDRVTKSIVLNIIIKQSEFGTVSPK